MLLFVVRLHGQVIQTLELSDPATTYWAGRGETCQIPLKTEKGISRQHFKIQLKDGLWQLEVTSSYGDIKSGEESIRQLVLQEGLSFSLAPYEFKIESQHTQSISNELSLASGDTSSKALSIKNVEFEKTVTRFLDKNKQFIFTYFNKETKESKTHILTSDEYMVGRDQGCDIIIDDARVSRRQFKIYNQNGNFYLIDNKSINPTILNGSKITNSDPILLKSHDEVKILNHKFHFEIRDAEFESKLKKINPLVLVEPSENQLVPYDPSGSSMGLEGSPGGGDSGQSGHTGSESTQNFKTLNFWGFKIPLNKVNKIRIGLGIALLIIIVVLNSNNNSTNSVDVASQPANPLSKLTPEEQKQVKVQYELAKDLYTKGNYQMAKEELSKVHAKVPSYLDSLELARFIEVGIQSAQEREQQERLKREAAEAEEKIQNIVAFCRQQLKPNASVAESDECLAPAIQLNPEHELIQKMRGEIARLEEQRKAVEAEKAFKEAQAAELEKQYKAALEISQKDPYKGKKAFEDFLKLTMADPKKLHEKAKKQLIKIERQIEESVSSAIKSVKSLVEAGKHKDAIIALERAEEVSPQNESLGEEIIRITEDLRKKMQTLFQEAILEENIGNIDTAKDRWRKILDQDIPNGEYYTKAKLKLKKYGGS